MTKKKRHHTIRDIAKLASVSHTTVSLALSFDNSKPSRISPEIRAKVLRIAKQLNYRPSHVARSLATKETKTIGLVLRTLRNPFYAELAQDIIDRAMDFEYKVFMASLRDGIDEEQKAVEGLIDRGVDGLIITSALRKDPVIDYLSEIDIPLVLAMRDITRSLEGSLVCYVGVNNTRGGYLAVDHLFNMRHERIGLIAGPDETSTGHDRKLGALTALNKHKIKQDPDLLIAGDFGKRSGYEATLRLMNLKAPPTAFFVMNDMMALGTLEALRELGLRVPEDIAVIGFGDTSIAGLAGIDLTTISPPNEFMGKIAVEYLLEIIKDGPQNMAKTCVLDPVLVVRKTCGFYLKEKAIKNIAPPTLQGE